MKKAISYYLSHPIQYFSPLLKEMAKEFDLSVYYLSDVSIKGNIDKGFGQSVKWDIPLLDGYHYRFIRNYSWRKSMTNRFLDLINPGIFKSLIQSRSSIIMVNGWSYLSVLVIILFSKILGKEVWLRAENPLHQEQRKSKYVIFFKKIVLQYGLFKFVDRFLFIGTESKKFFMFYGVKEADLTFTPYAVDNEFFQACADRLRPHKSATKKKLGLPEDAKIILFVGKYIEKKRPLDLLNVFHSMNDSKACLVMVGEGELRQQMEGFVKQQNLQGVVLTGFINQSQITDYYSVADIFVMCSGPGETWGLSVNEAMNFGLPIVVTDTCGCSHDLVQNEINGFIVEEGNSDQLKQAMSTLLAGKIPAERIKQHALKKISEFSIPAIMKELKAAVNEC